MQGYLLEIFVRKGMRRPEGFIFDYGGTIDTKGCHWGKMIWHAYQHEGVPVGESDFRDAYVFAERTLGRNPIIQSSYTFYKTLEVKLRIEMEYLNENHLLTGDTSPWVASVLANLYSQVSETVGESRKVLALLSEHYPLVLVSNFYGNINVVLEEFHLSDLFQTVIESAVVGVRKPNPTIFTKGVEALGLAAGDVVVVGDSFTKDIIPATKAGCRAVWLKGEGWTDEKYDESVPELVISQLETLLKTYI